MQSAGKRKEVDIEYYIHAKRRLHLDPADAGWFDTQRENFESTALARYDELEGRIKAKYAGTPIGASESIVSPLADSLGLQLINQHGQVVQQGTRKILLHRDPALLSEQAGDR